MKKIFLILIFVNLSLWAQKKVITVTIEPQKYIVDKIVKNHMKVRSIYKGSDFNIQFKKLALKEISFSDLYMIIGLEELEKSLLKEVKLYNSDIEVFDMSKNIVKKKFFNQLNPYIWMDPLNVRKIAKNVFFKVSEMDPKNRSFYRENFDAFAKELDNIYVKVKLHFSRTLFSVYRFDGFWDYYLSRFHFRFYAVKQGVLHASEIPTFIKQSSQRQAEVLIVDPHTPLGISQSIASNASARIVQSDIYEYGFVGEMLLLAKKLTK